MARKRTTYDEYELWSNNGYGWGFETTELSIAGKIERSIEYRENCPGLELKWKHIRVPLAKLEAGEWEANQEQIAKDIAYHKEMKAQRKAARLAREAAEKDRQAAFDIAEEQRRFANLSNSHLLN